MDSFFQITLGYGIPLTEDGGLPIAQEWVYEDIYIQISRILAKYHGHEVIEVGIRAYMGKATANRLKYSPASVEDRERELESVLQARQKNLDGGYIHEVKAPRPKVSQGVYTNYIKAIRHRDKKRKPFLVGDIETLPLQTYEGVIHIPYAVGLLMVQPGEKITPYTPVTTYCTESYK